MKVLVDRPNVGEQICDYEDAAKEFHLQWDDKQDLEDDMLIWAGDVVITKYPGGVE